jgi:2-polyprenyl-6-methoxyphenol hydroxylase-like FAD-dependent oxidoreductase
MNYPSNQHVIVIGGSLAGLLAARVLSDHFERVTILERDPVHDRPESRKGQPQTRHPHGLLTSGLKFVNRYFPGLETDLIEKGAIIADQGLATRFFFAGSYRTPFESGLQGILVSRPLMEWQIRRRVAALPNVTLCDETLAEKLVTTPDRTRVTGVVIGRRGAGKGIETLTADFVVDAAGRGSLAPKWLESTGYAQLEESVVKIDVSYSTRLYRRNPGDLGGAYVIITLPWYPAILRGGFMVAQEDNRWMLTLAGWGGDHPPRDEAGFVEFARSLPAPDIYETINQNEPLSDIVVHKFPSNLRRHYEKMSRFPEGYLVLGDAVCTFNPIYGQGMSSAALQAAELDKVFTEQQEQGHSQGIWQRYFKRVAKVVDSIWQSAVGADFNYPTTEGKKAPGTDLINAYMTRLMKVSNDDPVVCLALLKAMNLLVPSTSLFHPRIMWRVMRGRISTTQPNSRLDTAVEGYGK